jgi:hypothetical protein
MSHSASKRDTPPSNDALEPLTDEQREAVRAWREGGMVDSPQVAALRKRARGEPLSDEERALLARPGRKPQGPTVPHEAVMRELEERQRRGG